MEKNRNSKDIAVGMDLSVILCTWNNAARLRITLDAIAQCEVPERLRWEVVLVNNNCTDDTDAVAAEFADRLPLRTVREPRQGLSHARNAGLAAACGEWVLFTDDDVRPYPQWLEAYVQAYQTWPEGHYFGGPLESEYEVPPPTPEILAHAPPSVHGFDKGPDILVGGNKMNFLSANWSAKRLLIIEAGGFDERIGLKGDGPVSVGEESDVMRRLSAIGLTPVYLPEARIRHFVPADKLTREHILSRFWGMGYQGEVLKPGKGSLAGIVWAMVKAQTSILVGRLRGRDVFAYECGFEGRKGQLRARFDMMRIIIE